MPSTVRVILDRQPHRDAVERIREAYRFLKRASPVQEVRDEPYNRSEGKAIRGTVCPGLDPRNKSKRPRLKVR